MTDLLRDIYWAPWDEPGLEHLHATMADDGAEALGLILRMRGGEHFRCRYELQTDPQWRVRQLTFAVMPAGGSARPGRIELESDGQGNWRRDGAPCPELEGCLDLDIQVTPFTNTLPIRRLGLARDESAKLRVAYLSVPELVPQAVEQRYTCLVPFDEDGGLYRYEGLFRDFMAELPVDGDGLVLDYPETSGGSGRHESRPMKAAVIVFPGSNCDRDVQVALRQSMDSVPIMVWHKDADFDAVDLIVLPGGFSYGDYLRSGAMAARSPVMKEVVARARKGVPLLGICNGFQVLTETGLVPGALMRNANLKFVCKDVHVRVETSQSLFTCGYETGQAARIPVAHHDGNYFADDDTLARLEDKGQIAFRYCSEEGDITPEANPNGSRANIAGVYNEGKSVLGLMPHPERLADPQLGGTDGRALFDGLVRALS